MVDIRDDNPVNYISVAELAKHLGISRIAVFKRIKAGKIKAIKIGRSYAIPRSYLTNEPDCEPTRFTMGALDSGEYLSVPELATELNTNRITLFYKIKRGEIPAVKVGRHYVIPRSYLTVLKEQPFEEVTSSTSEYLSLPELAEKLGVSRITIFNLVKQGKVQAKRIGRHYVVREADLDVDDDQQKQPEAPVVSDQYISVMEAAKQLGISRIAVFKKIKNGQIRAERMGRSYSIPVREIEKVQIEKLKKRKRGKR